MKKTLALCALLTTASLSAQETINWRGTDRTGIYNEAGLLKTWPTDGLQLQWSFEKLGDGHTSVAIDSDKLYVTGLVEKKGVLYVFDLAGKLLNQMTYGDEWTKSYEGPRGTVTINEGNIYLVSGMGVLYCINQESLKEVWKKDILAEYNSNNIMWGINEAPLIVGDKIIVTPGGKEKNIVAIDKKSGKSVWSSVGEGDPAAYCSPLFIGDQQVPIIVTMTANHIVGVNADNGAKLWSYEHKNTYSIHPNTPIYKDGMLLCFSGYGEGAKMLKILDGGRKIEKVWALKEFDSQMGAAIKIGDYVYGFGHKSRKLYCVDWKTGAIKWEQGSLSAGNIISNDGMLYCYLERGDILLLKANPEKFEQTGQLKVTLGTAQHWAHPVLYKGSMYVRHGNALMSYKVK